MPPEKTLRTRKKWRSIIDAQEAQDNEQASSSSSSSGDSSSHETSFGPPYTLLNWAETCFKNLPEGRFSDITHATKK